MLLNTQNYQIKFESRVIHVEPLAFNIIVYLLQNRDRCVGRDELFDKLWPNQVVSDGSLSNEIKYIRKLLGDDGRTQRLIRTVHGRGYQFVAGVKESEPNYTQTITDLELDALDPEQNKYASIPIAHTEFIGRAAELDELELLLSSASATLVSIVGPGGIGKTRIASELAHRIKDKYPDGVFYISFTSITDPTSALKLIGNAVDYPLGIELAASWLRIIPLENLASEISQSLMWLESDFKDIPERHRTSRALFESTWNRLPPELQNAFTQLTLFTGGFSREAAYIVCDLSLPQLALLEQHCLIIKDEVNRFKIHELLRQFGVVKLTNTEHYQKRLEKYANYCTEYCIRNLPITKGLFTIEDIETLRFELPNLENCLPYLMQQKRFDDAYQILRFIFSLDLGPLVAFDIGNQFIPSLKGQLSVERYHGLLNYLIVYGFSSNRFEEVLMLSEESLKIAKSRKHIGLEGYAESYIYGCYNIKGVDKKILNKLLSSLYKKLKEYAANYHGSPTEQSIILTHLCAHMATEVKELEDCKKYNLKAFADAQEIKSQHLINKCQSGLAIIYSFLGDSAVAMTHIIAGLKRSLELKNLRFYGVCITMLALIATLNHNYTEAIRMYGRFQGLSERISKRPQPIEVFVDDNELLVLKEKVPNEEFDRVWQEAKQESFKQMVNHVDAFIVEYFHSQKTGSEDSA